jgi:hypothetical protein
MHCPTCGAALVLALAAGQPEAEGETADPLAPVVRRLEAELYEPVPPPPENGNP